nr:hypothetical protein FICFSXYB_FICFSXYB_CDS_0004 [Microvirus sp.]
MSCSRRDYITKWPCVHHCRHGLEQKYKLERTKIYVF